LLIVENVQADEKKAAHIIDSFRYHKEDGAVGDVAIFFTAESYFGAPEEHEERENIFHYFDHVVKAMPGEDEFETFSEFLHESLFEGHISRTTLELVRRVSDRLLSVGTLAVEGLEGLQVSIGDPRSEIRIRERIVRKIQEKYGLLSLMEEAKRAIALGLYEIPLIPAAFGREVTRELHERGFLVERVWKRNTFTLFAPGVARLWAETDRLGTAQK
jgi:hypothetical protein